jgi:hypothetical protein
VRGRARAAVAAASLAGLAALACAGAWWAWLAPAIALHAPAAGARVGVEGLELLARFEPAGRVEPATVRVLLNGADVTAACVTASNGIHGRLHGLLEGENRVRVEAFVRARWPAGLLVAQAREVRVWFRPPLGFDRG